MNDNKLIIKQKSVRKKLKFSYKQNNYPSFYYVSHPETGNIVHKSALKDSVEHEIPLEYLESGIYNLIIVDGESIHKHQFEVK